MSNNAKKEGQAAPGRLTHSCPFPVCFQSVQVLNLVVVIQISKQKKKELVSLSHDHCFSVF